MANFYVRSTDGNDADDGSTWALAKATLQAVVTAAGAAGVVFFSQVHAEAPVGVTITLPTTPGLKILCGNDAAEPPTALTTGGKIASTGNAGVVINGFGYIYGLEVQAGVSGGGSNSNISLGGGNVPCHQVWDNCKFNLLNASATLIDVGGAAATTNDDIKLEILGGSLATFKFSAVGQSVRFRDGRFVLSNITIDAAGSAPTTLFKFVASVASIVVVQASDLTGKTWTNLVDLSAAAPSSLDVIGCKLPASFTPSIGTIPGAGGPVLRIHRCNNGDTQSYFYEGQYEGSSEYASTIYRTAGAQDDDSTHFSCKMISSANTKLWDPLRSPKFSIPITAVGSSVTVTAYLAVDGSAPTLDNSGVWMEILEYTTSGVPLGVVQSSRVADVLTATANLSTSTEGWTGLGGTNAKFQIALSFTPQEKGSYVAQIVIAEASRTLYADFDPLVV